MKKGKIILLNGVSSSGKTTVANELVKELHNYFVFSGDDFDDMINGMEDRKSKRLIPVETEFLFHRNIAIFSDMGVNLIVDHVIHDANSRKDILPILKDYPVLFVGVHCPLEDLERREQIRGDRRIGLAKEQLNFVHKNVIYDLELNTCSDNRTKMVTQILEKLDGKLEGFSKTAEIASKTL